MKKISSSSETVTAISFQGKWVKLLQAQPDKSRLLRMVGRQVTDPSEEGMAGVLRELIGKLPIPPLEVVGLLPSREVLTRYLVLPSDKLPELQAMAVYQLEGTLPYPLQECVVSVKVLGSVGEGTRVMVAVVHRPTVERILRICRKAGLTLTQMTTSSEGIGQWHQVCQPSGAATALGVSLTAEFTQDGLDLAVMDRGTLVYMRQVPRMTGQADELIARLQETIQAYSREKVGPPIEQITLSGWQTELSLLPLERLESALGLSVRKVDPLEQSPFRESLSITAQEISPEISFTELLGVACAPRLLQLDLLPQETKQFLAQQGLFQELRRVVVLAVVMVFAILAWVALQLGGTAWQLKQTQTQIAALTPAVSRVKSMAADIRTFHAARKAYAMEMAWLADATHNLPAGMTLQFLGVAEHTLTLRGSAPDLAAVTTYSNGLRGKSLWKNVTLTSAKTQTRGATSSIEFELLLEANTEMKDS